MLNVILAFTAAPAGGTVGVTTNWAGYFQGNTYVGGNLTVGDHATPGLFSGISPEANNTLINFGINSGREGTFDDTRPGYWIRTDTRPGLRGIHFFKKEASTGTETQLMTIGESGHVSIGQESVGGNLTVNGNSLINTLTVANGLTLNVLGPFGAIQLCRNASNLVSTCSPSSIRYKGNIASYSPGLSFIYRLRPVTYNWKHDGTPDFGLIAEEVAEIEPFLINRNDKGEVESVKYDRISVVLVNAVKDSRRQIEAQAEQIEDQQRQVRSDQRQIANQQGQIELLKKQVELLRALCAADRPGAEICKEERK